jgi:dienelactone hydrolase
MTQGEAGDRGSEPATGVSTRVCSPAYGHRLPDAERGAVVPIRRRVTWLADLRAAVAYVRGRSDVDAQAVGLYGSSLRGGLAVALARRRIER